MSIASVPAAADLMIPKPAAGETWASHTIHTHYFGFTVPQANIGVFIYLRCQPVFNLCSGGVCIFQGMDNLRPLDCEHSNYVVTMPYPEVVNNVIETVNGLRIEFIEPGKVMRVSYRSADGQTHFDVLQTALTIALPRGHVMPGEDDDAKPEQKPGGLEQFMHCVGELVINGEHHDVDCYPVRDRSWRQVRTEDEVRYPAVGWSPMYFNTRDDALCFNQVGYELHDKAPWRGAFDVDESKPAHYFAWLVKNGEVRNVPTVQRKAFEYHPDLFVATVQEIVAIDDKGDKYRFHGECVALAQLPSWPNGLFFDSVYRWTDEQGHETYCAYQEAWYHRYQRHMRRRLKAGS